MVGICVISRGLNVRLGINEYGSAKQQRQSGSHEEICIRFKCSKENGQMLGA